MKENYCLIIDSGMNILKVKQSKIQELLDNKDIAPLDIKEQIGIEDITELIEEILIQFNAHNKFELRYVIQFLEDLIIEEEE